MPGPVIVMDIDTPLSEKTQRERRPLGRRFPREVLLQCQTGCLVRLAAWHYWMVPPRLHWPPFALPDVNT